MKNKYFITIIAVFVSFLSFAQEAPDVFVEIENAALPCYPGDCVTLTAKYSVAKPTTDYTVASIIYSPLFAFDDPTATQIPIPTTGNQDDFWSANVFNLPFPFCFYGTNYDNLLVGSNGVLKFGPLTELNTLKGNFCIFDMQNVSIPSAAFVIKNAIYGIYQDIDFQSGIGSINYKVFDTYPNRTFVMNVSGVPQWPASQNGSNLQTTQIVLYETTNIIDVLVKKRVPGIGNSSWPEGVLGIQNALGTKATTPPGRNTGTWSVLGTLASPSEAWRFTPSGLGTENVSFVWKNEAGEIISQGNGSAFNSIVVCPDEDQTYTVEATFIRCDNTTVTVSDSYLVEIAEPLPVLDPEDITICEATFPVTVNVNQDAAILANVTVPSDFEILYFFNEIDAQNQLDSAQIPTVNQVTNIVLTDSDPVTIYTLIRETFGGACVNVRPFVVQAGTPKGDFTYPEDPADTDTDTSTFCFNTNSALAPVLDPDDGLTSGGTYTVDPPTGLTIDSVTGILDLTGALEGTYTINYDIAADPAPGGCPAFNANTIVIIESCIDAMVSNSGNVCEGTATFDLFATYTETVGATTTYEWKDNDGNVVSTSQNPIDVAVPANPGTYVYTLVITQNGSLSEVYSTTLIVYELPVVTFASNDTTICTNATTTLVFNGVAGSIVNFTDGNNNYSEEIGSDGTYSFTTPALTVNTTYTIVDAESDTNPICTYTVVSGTPNTVVTISVGLPTATIDVFTNPVICSGEETFLQIVGTPNAIVSYTIGGVAQTDVILEPDGTYQIPTGIQTVAGTFTYALTNVESNPAPPAASCSDVITGQSATLTVNALPTASFTVVDATICEGGTAELNFTGTPNATVTYSNGSQTLTTPLNGTGTSGPVTTTALLVDTTFTLVSVEVTDSNNVTCSNTITGTVTVTMNDNVAITSPVDDYEVTICPGDSQTFTTVATGDGLTYQWYFNGTTPLPSTTNSYTVSNATAANTGDYTVIVLDGCGNQETSAVATLTVSQATEIIIEPAPTPQTVCEGTAISIEIVATGTNLTYQWFRGTTPVSGATATTPTLTINSTVVADSGDYTCHITSGTCGTIISNIAKLTVNQAPAIVAQTGGGAICVGETANFSVTATGTNLTYQWYKGSGELIANETSNTYSIPNATEADSNTYYCTISSTSCAPIDTTPVILTVKPLPTATISQGTPSTICEGESTQVIFNGTPLAVVVYTINGGTPETITLDVNGGDTILPTGNLTETTVYELVSVTYTGVDACSQNLTGSATVTVNPLPTVSLEDGFICIDPVTLAVTRTYTLETGLNEAEFTFEWFDENGVIANQSNSFYEASAVGQYGVTITDIITGCQASAFANVDSSSPPTDFSYTVNGFFADNPTVVITATPIGQYEYQLDYGPFQESNIFDNIEAGPHTITVRDPEACDVLTKDVLIIDYPKYFTPNGDGINDTWNIPEINGVSMTKIYIFDRFGKLVKEMTASGSGWDGTYNGQELPATDYWFTINYQEVGINKEFRAHFSMKR